MEPVYDEDFVNLGYLNKHYNSKVLYDNEDLTSFNAQSIDIEPYDYYMVMAFRNPTADTREITTIIEKNKDAEILYTDYYNSTVRAFTRSMAVSEDGKQITFGNCSVNGTTNNGLLIPYIIIGFKYTNL